MSRLTIDCTGAHIIDPGLGEETARVGTAAFPDGNLYRRMRDELGSIFTDVVVAPLFAVRGRPAKAPWRLALVTILP